MATRDVIDADDFKAVFRNNIPKRLARSLSAPLTTARALVYRGVWPSRRREVALVLAEQIRKEKQALAEVEAKIARILGEFEDGDGRESNKNDRATIPNIGNMADRPGALLVRTKRPDQPEHPPLHKAKQR